MLALRDKYKPKIFSEMVGLEKYSKQLNYITKNKLIRPYVIYGLNGSGKTTFAEILWKRLLCQESKSLDPCLKCDSCRTTDMKAVGWDKFSYAGRDLTPEKIHEMSDSFFHYPVVDDFHSALIDDLDHSNESSQQLLIKLINYYPETLLIFTVTESSKIITPLLQRCSPITLIDYTEEDLLKLVRRIALAEDIIIENDKVLLDLIENSNFNPRSVLNILEAIITNGLGISQEALNSPNIIANFGLSA